MSARRRLTKEQRRDELMDAGAIAFGEAAYEDVSLEDIARRANASRALMYHYFPTKRDLFAAVWRRAHERLTADLTLDEGPLRDVVTDVLARHMDFYQAHAALVMVANRSSIANDPVVRAPIADGMRMVNERILDATGATGHARDVASTALAGWIAFIREVTVQWLEGEHLSRAEVLDLCLSVLDVSLEAGAGSRSRPSRRRAPRAK